MEANDQILNSYTQAIAKMETKLEKMANTLNRVEDIKLPNQLVANPRGQYVVDESTSNLKQVQAITTLRSWKMFDNHVEDTMD